MLPIYFVVLALTMCARAAPVGAQPPPDTSLMASIFGAETAVQPVSILGPGPGSKSCDATLPNTTGTADVFQPFPSTTTSGTGVCGDVDSGAAAAPAVREPAVTCVIA
uniref:Secreted protein n=1 Tax=Mycena chlorophos TaxID=658473 RepID=A0ABQ0LGV1_MYCCL|nr:predicted protein [Mycena chlorophos]